MLDVCLLGTGGMMPLPYRWLTSLMMRYNGQSILIDCGEGNINNVVVEEAYRGQGLAYAMMQELLIRGREMGCTEFTLEVRVSNAPAIHVYQKLGFVSEGIRPRFYEKPVEDAMIMWIRQN